MYIYIFTGEVLNGTTNIFTNSKNNYCYKDLRDQFFQYSVVLTTHDIFHFNNQVKGNMTISVKNYQQNKNQHDFYYRCSKDGPDFYLVTQGQGI